MNPESPHSMISRISQQAKATQQEAIKEPMTTTVPVISHIIQEDDKTIQHTINYKIFAIRYRYIILFLSCFLLTKLKIKLYEGKLMLRVHFISTVLRQQEKINFVRAKDNDHQTFHSFPLNGGRAFPYLIADWLVT